MQRSEGQGHGETPSSVARSLGRRFQSRQTGLVVRSRMGMRHGILVLVSLVLFGACRDGGEPPAPAATPEPAVDYASLPAFSLDGCTPRSPDNLGRGRCDPVNLVFPATPYAEVANALLAAGWSPLGLGSPQAVLPPGATELLLQSAQLFKAQGNALTGPRFHIRLWQLPDGTTIGAAHHETGIEHDIDLDWDAAEAEVE